MSKTDLTTPTRQSIKGLVLIFLQTIRTSVRMFWALIAVLVLQKNLLEHKAIIPIVLLVLLILFIVHSILYYRSFFFHVKDGEFILKKGYLRKVVLTIPLERIQSVNTKQNLIQQILDVVALEIDTAGTAGKELKIHALEKPFANALHDLLSSKKTSKQNAGDANETEAATETEQVILKLEPLDLLKIGISQNHLRTGLILIAFGSQFFNQVQDVFEEQAEKYSSAFVDFMSNSGLAIIIFLIVFFLLVSIFFSLFRTLLKYFDFKLLKKKNAYRIESGIVNKRNVVVPHHKIQQLNWETDPVKRLFDIYHLVFKQAVSMQNKKIQMVDAPGCLTPHLEDLKHDLFGEDKLSKNEKIKTDKYYFKPLWLFSGWLPVLVATPFLYAEWLFWLAAILWLPVSGMYCLLVLRKSYFKINNEQIRVSKGAISQKWQQMELYKIQSVAFKQTFFQKNRSLASLQIMNASGSITIPYINEILAIQLYNYFLYHSETSKSKWM